MDNRAMILGVPIDKVTLDSAMDRIIDFFSKEGCAMVCTPNTEIVMAATRDKELLKVLSSSQLCVPDGIGLVYASKIHKLGLRERVAGVDLMKRLLNYAHDQGLSIYILGGKKDVARLACENIKKEFPSIEISGFHDGYFEKKDEESIIKQINEKSPDILFVALGAPRQEKWIYNHKAVLKTKIAMGVGGSVDIWAGTAKRAPVVFQRLGLEWFYRLLKEPWRYKRMLVLPKFMIRILLSK